MITVHVKTAERDAGRVVRRWNADLHPRDKHGRFVEKGGTVRLADGLVGRVIGHAGDKVQVRAGGHVIDAAAHTLEVVPPGTRSAPHAAHAAPAARAARPGKAAADRAKLTPTSVRDLREGDRAMLPHPDTERLEPATIVSHDDNGRVVEMDARRADGAVHTIAYDRDSVIDRIDDAGVEPEEFPDETETGTGDVTPPPIIPDPAPPRTLLARPPLYTYQRQKIVSLELDRDRTQSAEVRQAAAAVRLRMPLTAIQANALADAVQLASTRADLGRPQRRALTRISDRLQGAAAEIHGSGPPSVAGRTATEATAVRDLTEGDTVALADRDGNVDVVHVRGITSSMGGRVTVLDLEHQDGTRETRTVTGRTQSWLLPDPPDDEPAPPAGDQREHITPDRLRIGDTITAGGSTGRLASIEPEDDGGYRVQFIEDSGRLTGTAIKSHDGGPAVIRIARGPASQDQPWDAVMPPEHPQQIEPTELRVGDRVTMTGRYGITTTGTVQSLELAEGDDGSPGVRANIRRDDSRVDGLALFDHDPDFPVTRLIQGDGNTAAQIEAERAAREGSAQAREIRGILDRVLNNQRGDDFHWLDMTISHSSDDVLKKTMAQSKPIPYQLKESAAQIRRMVNPQGRDAESQQLAEQRIVSVLREIAARQHDNFVESLLAATGGIDIREPDASQRIFDARRRVADQWRNTPPPVDTIQVSKALAAIADVMRDAPGGEAGGGRPDVPVLPEGTDLAARMVAYRQALPAPENIGKQTVVRHMFDTPTLADLEAGRVPEVKPATIAVPDTAEDGGPGHMAMRHLDIVMAAGKDLDAEVVRRIVKYMDLTPEREARHYKAKSRIDQISDERSDLFKQQWNDRDAARDEYARDHGFADYRTMNHQVRLVGPAEAADLRQQIRAADAAGDAAEQKVRDRRQALSDEKTQLEKDLITDKMRGDARRKAAMEVLSEVRPDGLGGVKLNYRKPTGDLAPLTERGETVKAMRWAEQHYPTSWLAKARDRGGLVGNSGERAYRLGTVQRGHYSDSKREIRLSKGREQVTGGGIYGDVSVHELGHAMEQAVPGVLALQHAYLWSRTSSGEVGSRVRDKKTRIYSKESGYKDEFPEHYTGKDYGDAGNPVAFEVLTTAAESLFAGSKYLDDSLRQWVLGVLATT